MSEIIIRHAESKDIEGIQAIYAGEKAYSETLHVPYISKQSVISRMDNLPTGVYSLVAELDNEIVGQLGLEACQIPRRNHVGNLGMGVADSHQGKGIGSKLLAAALDLAENWLNLTRIELTVFTDNEAAVSLYKKYGFVIEGESAKYAFRNGKYVNVYHMARIK